MNLTIEQAEKIMKKSGDSLDLSNTQITTLPDNLTVGDSLDLSNTQITTLPDNLTVGDSLDLSNTQITTLPDNLTVGGSLYLSNTQITTLPDNLTVGGWLGLSNTQITTLPDNLTVGDSLDLSNTQITTLPDNLTVGDSLDLRNTQITTLPDNLTVGGWLDLRNTQITTLPDNLTVGGWLDLRNTQITTLPDNLTVGGNLYLSNTQIKNSERIKVKRLKNGDYAEGKYLYADEILTHIKNTKTVNGYTIYVGKINGKNVVSDGKNYAHCNKIRDGIADLLFKAAADRGANQYKNLSLDTEMTVEELVTMYRIITGACRQGSESFVNSLGKLKSKYTIREALDITQGQYGSDKFQEFFNAN